LADADQALVDDAVRALAWSLYRPEHARELAELAVAGTGLGNVADKIAKNRRKTFGTLRDLLRVRTVGVIEEDPARGIVKYAKPVGVVGALTPSTNPAATPVNKAMMALKGRNAIVIAPSPAGWATTARAVELMRAALAGMGLPADLVQVVPQPVDRARTQALMRAVDLVVCTGSQTNVREAYRSGTPAIGVGAGNVPVIVDESADLADAAAKIARSKCFDNATSCSSENALVVLDEVYADLLAALARNGEGTLYSIEIGRRPNEPDHEYFVPDHLRDRWRLVIGDSRRELPGLMERCGPVDIFYHDSLHTYEHMVWEFGTALPHLGIGGLLASDDVLNPTDMQRIFRPGPFHSFCSERRIPFQTFQDLGLAWPGRAGAARERAA